MAKRYFVGYSTHEIVSPSKVRHYDIELTKRDILNHFMTKKGERPMQPNFGSVVWDVLFEHMTKANKDLIYNDSKNIIESDPRVEVVDIKIQEFEHGIALTFLLDFNPGGVRDNLYVEFRKELSQEIS